MLAIQPTKNSQKCTPNLIPARINHNGPINSTAQYFNPEKHEQGTSHVYLRGRHLHGTTLTLPENYAGAVLHITDKQAPLSTQSRSQSTNYKRIDEEGDEEIEDEHMNVDVKVAEQVGSFEEFVVWQHGEEVDASRDMFVRGMREWVGWAESMHCEESDRTVDEKNGA